MTNSITGLKLKSSIACKLLAEEIACEKAVTYIRICNEYGLN